MLVCLSCGHKLSEDEEMICLGLCPKCGRDSLQYKIIKCPFCSKDLGTGSEVDLHSEGWCCKDCNVKIYKER